MTHLQALEFPPMYFSTINRLIVEYMSEGNHFMNLCQRLLENLKLPNKVEEDRTLTFRAYGFDFVTKLEIEFGDHKNLRTYITRGLVSTYEILKKGTPNESADIISTFAYDQHGNIEISEKFSEIYMGHILGHIKAKGKIQI